jgi:hypothetical protein
MSGGLVAGVERSEDDGKWTAGDLLLRRKGMPGARAVKSGIEEKEGGPLGVVGTEMGRCDEPPPARDRVCRELCLSGISSLGPVTTEHDRTSS